MDTEALGRCGLLHRVIYSRALLKGMISHGDIIWMIIKVNVRSRQTVLIFDVVVQRDPVSFLWHILANDPHTSHIFIRIQR